MRNSVGTDATTLPRDPGACQGARLAAGSAAWYKRARVQIRSTGSAAQRRRRPVGRRRRALGAPPPPRLVRRSVGRHRSTRLAAARPEEWGWRQECRASVATSRRFSPPPGSSRRRRPSRRRAPLPAAPGEDRGDHPADRGRGDQVRLLPAGIDHRPGDGQGRRLDVLPAGRREGLPARLRRGGQPVHGPLRRLHRLRSRGVRAGGDRRPGHLQGAALGLARGPGDV